MTRFLLWTIIIINIFKLNFGIKIVDSTEPNFLCEEITMLMI